MVNVSVKQLLDAIEEADVYRLPAMSDGADYIYNNLYRRILRGEELKLSQIDWDGFELEDIDSMRNLYSGVLEANEYRADSIAETLRGISPTVTAAAFV